MVSTSTTEQNQSFPKTAPFFYDDINLVTLFRENALHRIPLRQNQTAVPDAFALSFDMAAGEIADFELHGISCPPSILQSVRSRRAEYLAGRRVALAALCEQGAIAADVPTGLGGAPVWPRGFIGSITHSSGIAAAVALTADSVHGIGIDIEHVPPVAALNAIRETAIDPREQESLAALARSKGWPFALTVAFSAKESFYKATVATVGRIFDFDGIKIIGIEDRKGMLDVKVADALTPALPQEAHFALGYREISENAVITSCVW